MSPTEVEEMFLGVPVAPLATLLIIGPADSRTIHLPDKFGRMRLIQGIAKSQRSNHNFLRRAVRLLSRLFR